MRKLEDVVCPKCEKEFKLAWQDYGESPVTLSAKGCPSGGIYDVSIKCPHCEYEEHLS